MDNFVNQSTEDNSITRDSDTDQSDSLDLSEPNNLSNAENQGLLLLQRLKQLKVSLPPQILCKQSKMFQYMHY